LKIIEHGLHFLFFVFIIVVLWVERL